MKFNFKNVTIGTWARIITLLLSLINLVSTSIFNFRLLPWSDEELNQGVALALTIITSLVAGWKNNSITEKAQYADNIMKEEE